MIIQVHDELNFNVLSEEKECVQQIVIEELEHAYAIQVLPESRLQTEKVTVSSFSLSVLAAHLCCKAFRLKEEGVKAERGKRVDLSSKDKPHKKHKQDAIAETLTIHHSH